tara:strand:- start:41 stop:496 length:456 start_codon:yes stop_codon:yes gene_type:complete
MAITTSICNSFLGELLGGVHDLDTHTIKMALIKPSMSGTYNDETTNYSDVTGNSDEASGTNYSAGGQTLDSVSITTSNTGNRAFVDIADEVFSNVTCSARGCIIYNSSASDKAIAVFDFGSTISATAGDLTVTMPATGTNGDAAVIRIANS